MKLIKIPLISEVTEMIAEPMFTGASYLHYLDENIVKRYNYKNDTMI